MPWIQGVLTRQTPVFHRYGFGWSVTSIVNDRPDSAADPMLDSVLAEMLKALHRQLKWAEEEDRHMVWSLFEESQPHIERRLAELESRKVSLSSGEYLKEISK